MRVRLPPIRRMPTDVCTSWVQAGGGDWEPIWDRFLPQSCKEAENRKDFVVGSGLDERQQVGARTSSIHSERVGISRSTPDGRSALLPPSAPLPFAADQFDARSPTGAPPLPTPASLCLFALCSGKHSASSSPSAPQAPRTRVAPKFRPRYICPPGAFSTATVATHAARLH